MQTRSAARLTSGGSAPSRPYELPDGEGDIARDLNATVRRMRLSRQSTPEEEDSEDPGYMLPAHKVTQTRSKSRSRSPIKRQPTQVPGSAPNVRARNISDKMATQAETTEQAVLASSSDVQKPKSPKSDMYDERELTRGQKYQREKLGIEECLKIPKRAKDIYNQQFKPRTLRDLKGYEFTQLRFTRPHPKADWSNSWFEILFEALYFRVHDFAKEHFGNRLNFPRSYTWSPWSEEFSHQFISYASQIARKDELVGGWDALLKDEVERKYLVMGVIAKVLDDNVFSELLFGGNENQKEILKRWDTAMLEEEGYFRTYKRTQDIRYFLSDKILTPFFWPEVDRLAVRTTNLLLPLINLQGKISPTTNWPRLVAIHQEIHDIIAQSGYTAICMSWSTSIFRISFPEPGQHFDLDQEHWDDSVYNKSKKAVAADDEKREQAAQAAEAAAVVEKERKRVDQEAKAAAQAYAATPYRVAKNSKDFPIAKKKSREKSKEDEENSFYTPPMRGGKVKIVLWPLLKRFKPKSEAKGYGALEGEMIVSIFKAQVVYYYGRMDNAGEMEERSSLTKHAKSGRSQRWWAERGWPLGIILCSLFFLSLKFSEHLSFKKNVVRVVAWVLFVMGYIFGTAKGKWLVMLQELRPVLPTATRNAAISTS